MKDEPVGQPLMTLEQAMSSPPGHGHGGRGHDMEEHYGRPPRYDRRDRRDGGHMHDRPPRHHDSNHFNDRHYHRGDRNHRGHHGGPPNHDRGMPRK